MIGDHSPLALKAETHLWTRQRVFLFLRGGRQETQIHEARVSGVLSLTVPAPTILNAQYGGVRGGLWKSKFKKARRMKQKNGTVVRQYIKRNQKLRAAGFSSYQEFLKSPIWKEIHRRYKKKVQEGKHQWTHCYCCDSTGPFHLHHLNYKSVTSPILGSRIVPLCEHCHETVHKMTEKHSGWSIRKVTNHLRSLLGNNKRN
jgi:hypothetical protein